MKRRNARRAAAGRRVREPLLHGLLAILRVPQMPSNALSTPPERRNRPERRLRPPEGPYGAPVAEISR